MRKNGTSWKEQRGSLQERPTKVPLHQRSPWYLVDRYDVSVFKIARAGIYVWLHCPVSAGEKDNQRLLQLIRDSYALSDGVYVYRRVHCGLREVGEACSRNWVAKITKQYKKRAVHGYKIPRGTWERPSLIALNHLQREFTVVKFNQVG